MIFVRTRRFKGKGSYDLPHIDEGRLAHALQRENIVDGKLVVRSTTGDK